jgi:biopolymer transport protein ExbB/TolQ
MSTKKVFFRLSIFALLLLVPVTLQAQDARYASTAKELASDLSAKLTLNGDQISNVMNTLVDYQTNIIDNKQEKAEASEKVNSTIEGLLNEEQMVKWQAAKKEWWAKVNKKIAAHETETKQDAY